jgi:type II secretory ATPase GspE/PulE/Tfp pilus assembly ATPase PilB-like protein
LEIKEDIRHLIMNRASAQEIKDAAVKNGMTTMIQDALQKAQKGLTSIEEIIRVVHE